MMEEEEAVRKLGSPSRRIGDFFLLLLLLFFFLGAIN